MSTKTPDSWIYKSKLSVNMRSPLWQLPNITYTCARSSSSNWWNRWDACCLAFWFHVYDELMIKRWCRQWRLFTRSRDSTGFCSEKLLTTTQGASYDVLIINFSSVSVAGHSREVFAYPSCYEHEHWWWAKGCLRLDRHQGKCHCFKVNNFCLACLPLKFSFISFVELIKLTNSVRPSAIYASVN